jgi:alpha-glucosidase/alpha-D-xyloside xylohydrolase
MPAPTAHSGLLALTLAAITAAHSVAGAQQLITAGQPAQLDVRQAGYRSVRITLKPVSFRDDFPFTPGVAERSYPAPTIRVRELSLPVKATVGALTVELRPNPTTAIVTDERVDVIQEIVFTPDGNLSFKLDDQPVLGMGEGGPRPAPGNWRLQPVQFDRRGALDTM